MTSPYLFGFAPNVSGLISSSFLSASVVATSPALRVMVDGADTAVNAVAGADYPHPTVADRVLLVRVGGQLYVMKVIASNYVSADGPSVGYTPGPVATTSGSWKQIAFSGWRYSGQPGSAASLSSGFFVVKKSGWHVFSAGITFGGNSNGRRILGWDKSSQGTSGPNVGNGLVSSLQMSVPSTFYFGFTAPAVRLNAGEIWSLYAYQDSGSTLNASTVLGSIEWRGN